MIERLRGGSRAATVRLLGAIAVACLLAPLTLASAAEDEAAEAADGAYAVPVPEWVARGALELKREFVMGVARQAVSMAEASATEEVQLLVGATDDMAGAGAKVESTMSKIGSIDSSFGIPGISRLVTAEGAVRDTLFGFVVWHESAAGESREIASDLESEVARMVTLATEARKRAATLASNADEVRSALAAEDYSGIASSSGVVDQATRELEAIAAEAEEVSTSIEEIVWQVQDGGSSLLETEWQQVLLAASDTRRLAAKIRPALVSLREESGASDALSQALQGMVESIAVMESARSDEYGSYYYPSSLFERDCEVVISLEKSVSGEDGGMLPEDSADSVEWLISKVVAADRMLAERSVEYTSTRVARAMDLMEERYKNSAGFDESASRDERLEAYEAIDAALRRNEDLQAARISAREARTSLEGGKSLEIQGSGSWGAALREYRDAWARADEAGESALKAVGGLS
ncbi:MAG: hypothetical protein GF400_02060 [Candidatus Eisenbacteria bacterium]|nr:hypothetical protein [Candidatus Eisenbacteria bacterium]